MWTKTTWTFKNSDEAIKKLKEQFVDKLIFEKIDENEFIISNNKEIYHFLISFDNSVYYREVFDLKYIKN